MLASWRLLALDGGETQYRGTHLSIQQAALQYSRIKKHPSAVGAGLSCSRGGDLGRAQTQSISGLKDWSNRSALVIASGSGTRVLLDHELKKLSSIRPPGRLRARSITHMAVGVGLQRSADTGLGVRRARAWGSILFRGDEAYVSHGSAV